MIVAPIQGVTVITEREWQETRGKLASFRQAGRVKFVAFHNFFRLTVEARDLNGQDLKGQRTPMFLMV